jgi:hypothetical protein
MVGTDIEGTMRVARMIRRFLFEAVQHRPLGRWLEIS